MFKQGLRRWRTSSPLGLPYVILHFIYFSALRLTAVGLFFFAVVYARYLAELKEVAPLSDYQSPTITKIYSQEGVEVARLARENRLYVAYDDLPEELVHAFISAEDKRFFEHSGVDPTSIFRAVFSSVVGGSRLVGASTITQQLAKVMHSGIVSKRDVDTKIREALLALDIERKLTKEQIMELYLNEIPFGLGAFGVSSASLRYFGKDLNELGIGEMAFLASLPKSPTNYNPVRHNAKATERRDWVLGRMLANGHIEKADAWGSMKEPLPADIYAGYKRKAGDYFTDQVRRELLNHFGEKTVFEEGLVVQTTMDPALQEVAKNALRDGLETYDRRHGWRGSLGKIDVDQGDWKASLEEFKRPAGIRDDWKVALVTRSLSNSLHVAVQGGADGAIPIQNLWWARKWRRGQKLGKTVGAAWEVAKPGEVILVQATDRRYGGKRLYDLKQIPDVNGGLVAINPKNGHILALQGGYSFERSQFNRVSQAKRQPGSTFKPFVYLAALNKGYRSNSIVRDEELTITFSSGETWKPKNSTGTTWGKIRLARALQASRNLPTIWLAREVGMSKIVDYAELFGISYDMPRNLANSLGSWETSLLNMAGSYAMLARDGDLVIPTAIRTVKDRNNVTVFDSQSGLCSACQPTSSFIQRSASNIAKTQQEYSARSVRELRGILQGVFTSGTARSLAAGLPNDIAGKTGTTNNNNDAWFVGFTDELSVAVYVGFDTPKTLGEKEEGGRLAGPIFRDFFMSALDELQNRDPEFEIQTEEVVVPQAVVASTNRNRSNTNKTSTRKAGSSSSKKTTKSSSSSKSKKKTTTARKSSSSTKKKSSTSGNLFGFKVQNQRNTQPQRRTVVRQQPVYRQPVQQRQPVYQQPTRSTGSSSGGSSSGGIY